MKQYILLLALIIALPFVAAELDNYFSVRDNEGVYDVMPGDEFVISFTISNRDLVVPHNVTAYIDPCPVSWTCEENDFSFDERGIHPVNLTVRVPETAISKKYTVYILLESEKPTTRGNDRVQIDVLSEKMAETLTYEEYTEQEEEQPVPEPELYVEPVEEPKPEPEEVGEDVVEEQEPVPEPVEQPEQNRSELLESVDRLESSRQFVEYASAVLIVLLVFVVAGAVYSFKKKD
jgi:hypothetical protein